MARNNIDPPAESVIAFDVANAKQFNDAFEAWRRTAGDIEIVARETRKGIEGLSVEVVYWRPKRKRVAVGTVAVRRG